MMLSRISADQLLGFLGIGLAALSTTFGVYMTIHGQADGLGKSGDFSVFAQLAPHRRDIARRRPPPATDDLDMTATASIPKDRARGRLDVSEPRDNSASVSGAVPVVVLRAAAPNQAEIEIDGRPRIVRLGDTIPGAGEVLAIWPGEHPSLRTSRGLIITMR